MYVEGVCLGSGTEATDRLKDIGASEQKPRELSDWAMENHCSDN
jgi:hypothetical protein